MNASGGGTARRRWPRRTVAVSVVAALAVGGAYFLEVSPPGHSTAQSPAAKAVATQTLIATAGTAQVASTASGSVAPATRTAKTAGTGTGSGASAPQPTGATGTTGSATSSASADSASVAKIVASLPPAPAGTVTALDGLYQSMYKALLATGVPETQAGGTGELPAPASFDQLTTPLSSTQKAELYALLSGYPAWKSLTATYDSLAGQAAARPLTASNEVSQAAQTATKPQFVYHSVLPGSFPPQPVIPSGTFQPPPAPYVPTSPVGPASGITSCPSPAPGADYGQAGIYGATIAYDLLFSAANFAPTEDDIEVSPPPVGVDIVIPNPVRIVLAVLAGAAQITEDALAYQELAWTNCTTNNWLTYLGNVDNTTLNSYGLLKQMESTLDSLETNVNTLHGQVQNVQQTIDDLLTLGIEQALAAPPGSPPDAAYELPASEGGNLNSTPVGVQSVVTDVLASAKQAGLPVNQAATRYLAIANSALARGFYAAAYSDYAYAYQQAAQ